jgi:hypothetical protein
VGFEEGLAFEKTDRRSVVGGGVGFAEESMKDVDHGIDGGENMGFDASERREAKGGEALLEVTEIVPAEGEVVDEVSGALLTGGVDSAEKSSGGFFGVQEVGANRLQLVQEQVE